MNTKMIAVTCALVAVACNSADNKPAQEPVVTTSGQPAASPAPAPVDPTLPSANLPSNGSTSSQYSASPTDHYGTSTSQAGMPTNNQGATSPIPATPYVANDTSAADSTKNVDSTRKPDNTKVNERDRHGTLTPMDQGNSSSDTKITASIRKNLVGDKTLSFTAKNVKVITIGSKVTLRGPVKSDQEKATIESVVRQTAGVSDVDNQLEVKK